MTRKQLAVAAIAGQVVLIVGWLVLGVAEGHGYSAVKHYVSDLGASSSRVWAGAFAVQVFCGIVTLAFAWGALRPSLGVSRLTAIAAWLITGSLLVFDNITDAFFRLDCRLADVGCSASDQMESWHGKVHVDKFVVGLACTAAAPFVLASCMKASDAWRAHVRAARLFGGGFVVGAVAIAATDGTDVQGLVQRLLAAYLCAGLIALAVRVIQLES